MFTQADIKEAVASLTTYANWAPTRWDTKGLNLEDRQNWLVSPISKSRDSEAIEECNFDVMCDMLSAHDESDYEIHKFGHWACGFFEIAIVRPGSSAAEVLGEVKCKLENYPILNEHKLYEYEGVGEDDSDDCGDCECDECEEYEEEV